jgi:two-component system, NarL family, nitrate/nitrite response regulator NarL
MSMSSESVRILIVDDHTLLREALRDLLLVEHDFHVVGEAGDGEAALTLAGQTRPDVVLLDVEMPGHQPVQTVRQLAAMTPAPKVIILSMYDDPQLVHDLLKIGVYGYLHKGVSRQDLVLAIRGVSHSRQRVTISVPWEGATGERPGALSSREQEVLGLVANALSNRQIAGRLAISEGTVKRHMRNIFAKLGAVSRLDAVNKATATASISPGSLPGLPATLPAAPSRPPTQLGRPPGARWRGPGGSVHALPVRTASGR